MALVTRTRSSCDVPVTRLDSLELSSPDLLRGTKVSVLLDGYGKRLGSGASNPSDYEESGPVNWLDMFLSYSRHSSAVAKFVALKFYFHGRPAFLVGALAGMCAWVIWRAFHLCDPHTCARSNEEDNLFWWMWPGAPCFGKMLITSIQGLNTSGPMEWRPLCLSVGMAAFWLTFAGWGLFTRRCLPTRFIFLDTVCIHQTLSSKKSDGIRSLGAVLARAQVLVMAWDSTYFSRLWCVYEISAFRAANPDRRVDFVPVELGKFLAIVLAGMTVGLCIMGLLSINAAGRFFMLREVGDFIDELMPLKYEWQWIGLELYVLPIAFSSLVVMWVFPQVRTYLRFRSSLEADLAAFSVDRARCFCCDVAHKHPETGATVLCDREAIYASIRQWYAGGVQEFEASIRGDFKDDINQMLGPHLPYSYAVCISLPFFLAWLDFSRCCPAYVLWLGMVRLLLQAPLDVLLFLSVCRWLRCVDPERLGRCCYCVALPTSCVLVVLAVLVSELAVDWFLQWCRYSFASWAVTTVIELGLVYGTYGRTWKLKDFSCRHLLSSRRTVSAAEVELC